MAVIAFGAPRLDRSLRNWSPKVDRLFNNALADMRNPYATRLLFFTVFEPSNLPPLISCFGVSPAQRVNERSGAPESRQIRTDLRRQRRYHPQPDPFDLHQIDPKHTDVLSPLALLPRRAHPFAPLGRFARRRRPRSLFRPSC